MDHKNGVGPLWPFRTFSYVLNTVPTVHAKKSMTLPDFCRTAPRKFLEPLTFRHMRYVETFILPAEMDMMAKTG